MRTAPCVIAQTVTVCGAYFVFVFFKKNILVVVSTNNNAFRARRGMRRVYNFKMHTVIDSAAPRAAHSHASHPLYEEQLQLFRHRDARNIAVASERPRDEHPELAVHDIRGHAARGRMHHCEHKRVPEVLLDEVHPDAAERLQ